MFTLQDTLYCMSKQTCQCYTESCYTRSKSKIHGWHNVKFAVLYFQEVLSISIQRLITYKWKRILGHPVFIHKYIIEFSNCLLRCVKPDDEDFKTVCSVDIYNI